MIFKIILSKVPKGIWLYLIFFCSVSTFAQQDNNASRHPTDSLLQETISQERRLLLDQFGRKNLDSVRLTLAKFDQHPEIPVLWPAERLLLYYWVEKYDAIDSLAGHFDEACEAASQNHPSDQIVWNVLSYHALQNFDELVSWIDQSGCTDDTFNFLARLLDMLVHNDWDDLAVIQREITLFISQYPRRDEVSSEVTTIVPEPAGAEDSNNDPWLVGFGIGLGPTSLSGNIAQFLSTKACLSFDLNVYYRRWYFALLLQAVFAKLKQDIPVGNSTDVWEAGTSANISNYGLSFGYAVVDNEWLKMSPFGGFLVNGCGPSEQAIQENEALMDAGIRWGFSGMFGLNTEIKFYNFFAGLKNKSVLPSINVRLAYTPAMFNSVSSRYSGNMFFLTFGINLNVSSGW